MSFLKLNVSLAVQFAVLHNISHSFLVYLASPIFSSVGIQSQGVMCESCTGVKLCFFSDEFITNNAWDGDNKGGGVPASFTST